MLRLRLNSRLEQKVRDSIRPSEPPSESVRFSRPPLMTSDLTLKVITNFKSPHTIPVLVLQSTQVIVYNILYHRARVALTFRPSARTSKGILHTNQMSGFDATRALRSKET